MRFIVAFSCQLPVASLPVVGGMPHVAQQLHKLFIWARLQLSMQLVAMLH